VKRYDDPTEREDGVVGTGEVSYVRNQDGDPVAWSDTTGTQRSGISPGLLPQGSVGGLFPVDKKRDGFGLRAADSARMAATLMVPKATLLGVFVMCDVLAGFSGRFRL
jgi:hypothetical protein